MEKIKRTKGSTLLLAIVIISTVLFASIGVSTIISRQTREMANIGNEAKGFYISESIANSIGEDFEDMTDFVVWNEMTEAGEIEYKAVKEGDDYRVTVKIGDNYYSFVKKSASNKDEGIGDITIYFNHTDIFFGKFAQISWKYGENPPTAWVNMIDDIAPWQKYTITNIEEDYIEVKFRYRFGANPVDPPGEGYYLIEKKDILGGATKIGSGGVSPGTP